MSEINEVATTDDHVMLDAPAAARFTGVAIATLAKMRCMGGSPPYTKAGRKILYDRRDLVAWLNAGRVRNTAEGFALPRRVTEATFESCTDTDNNRSPQ
jgi:hypothetical protein